jgi:hypothetical protein
VNVGDDADANADIIIPSTGRTSRHGLDRSETARDPAPKRKPL